MNVHDIIGVILMLIGCLFFVAPGYTKVGKEVECFGLTFEFEFPLGKKGSILVGVFFLLCGLGLLLFDLAPPWLIHLFTLS